MKKEQLEKLSPELQSQINEALHETLCRTIFKLLKDSMENPGLARGEIQSAREFAEIEPDTDAAKELLGFLDSDEVKKAAY
jgi:hypothetical protein